jgi:hypothetical protein
MKQRDEVGFFLRVQMMSFFEIKIQTKMVDVMLCFVVDK